MKKLIILLFSFLLLIALTAQMLSICEGWDGSETRTMTYNGCQIEYTFCYRINGGLHEISIADMKILMPCNPSVYENNKKAMTDSIIADIATSSTITTLENWGDLFPIPNCKDGTSCLYRSDDKLCYSGWNLNQVTQKYEMVRCDYAVRSCNETIRVCWEIVNGQRIVQVTQEGCWQSGPPCPQDPIPCDSTNCCNTD